MPSCGIKSNFLVTHFVEKVLQDSGNSCQYTTQKFKEGLQQWLNFEPERWVGLITLETDVVGRLTFEAFENQIDIGWGQAFRGRISKNRN